MGPSFARTVQSFEQLITSNWRISKPHPSAGFLAHNRRASRIFVGRQRAR